MQVTQIKHANYSNNNQNILTFTSIYDYVALVKPFKTNTLNYHQMINYSIMLRSVGVASVTPIPLY